MSTKRIMIVSMIGLLSVTILGLAALAMPTRAAAVPAQPEIAQTEPACNTCHDSLYFLHDSGKAYCVYQARTRCVDCHNGDPTALDKATAHTNLVTSSVGGDYSQCQGCHPQDVDARVERFAAIAGFSSATYVPQSTNKFTAPPVSSAFPDISVDEGLSWQNKILISLAAVLLLVGTLVFSRIFHHYH